MARKPAVKWEDPPREHEQTRYGALSPYTDFWRALRENPGKWARFPRENVYPAVTTAIKNGTYVGIESGEFEAVHRRTRKNDLRGVVYVRYVGGHPRV